MLFLVVYIAVVCIFVVGLCISFEFGVCFLLIWCFGITDLVCFICFWYCGLVGGCGVVWCGFGLWCWWFVL